MYIKLKIFSKKSSRENEEPLFDFEVNGDNALKILILRLCEKHLGCKCSNEINEILNESMQKIKDCLERNGA